MYQALYRKWRPKTFSDVIGQQHITQTLQRQVAEDHLSHAYLFTGTRGTGKTTCAKILAKAVNCEHPVNGDPCNQCPSCLGIDNGSLLDVLELDAASNNGVDHVRALRDALSLLDQCAAAGGTIDEARVLDVLGLAGNLQTAQMMEHILRRDQQAALLLLHQLYSSGKEVGALLGELSTLARDLLIRMTAPEGGEALLSGGYSAAVMEPLAALASPQRLIHITSLLQDTTAALPLSTSRRTDAELCLLRLCDDSLCGDLTALSARVSRLERAMAGGGTPTPVRPPQPVSSPPQAASPPPSGPASADDIPWEEPPLEREPVIPADSAPVAPPPVSPAPPPSAAGAVSGLWERLIDAYKSQLPAMYRAFLDGAHGTLEGDLLTVVCASDFTKTQLHNVKVQSVLQEVTSQDQGRPIAVAFTVGTPPKDAPSAAAADSPAPNGASDKLDALIHRGNQFDNFTVK